MNDVIVYGAGGHTGRFVVAELLRRGIVPVLAGRSATPPQQFPSPRPPAPGPSSPEPSSPASSPGSSSPATSSPRSPRTELEYRVAGVDDPELLRRAVAGARVVVNTAGPFLDTALPLARAAVEAGAHYLDVTAEQPAVRTLHRDLDAPARAAGVAVVPAMAFYGGLADLLVTAVLDGGSRADEIDVAIGLDRWWPTAGTRVTGARNTAPRLVIRGGELTPLASPTTAPPPEAGPADAVAGPEPTSALAEPGPAGASAAPAPVHTWSFPGPLGEQPVVPMPFSEVITIDRHLDVGELRSYLNTGPLADLRDAATPAPAATDERGRSAQRFVVDVLVRDGDRTRRVTAEGRDIYAVTAPIVAEGVVRLLDGRYSGPGATAPGETFDAADVLAALERGGALTVRSTTLR